MTNVDGWINFQAAIKNANDARLAAFDGKPTNDILNLVAFAIMQQTSATQDALDQMHQRIERLHHKIDHMQPKRS